MKLIYEATYNFDKAGLRGANFDVLPFFRLFPPAQYGGYPTNIGWTIHFGWFWWTIIIHQYK